MTATRLPGLALPVGPGLAVGAVLPVGDVLRVASGGPVTDEELAALVVVLMSRGAACDGPVRRERVRRRAGVGGGPAASFEPAGAFGRTAPQFGGWDGRPGAAPATSGVPAHR